MEARTVNNLPLISAAGVGAGTSIPLTAGSTRIRRLAMRNSWRNDKLRLPDSPPPRLEEKSGRDSRSATGGKMKHATAEDLIQIAGLLNKIRQEKRIKERTSGIFYWRGKAFLHFHNDPRGLFADLRGPDDWERFAVNDRRGQALLRARMSQLLSNPGPIVL